ncbi:MAG: hypothetical protein SF028_00020 [Candidatus Sumerlaeia bacterium]|nr:hypothetical protein [Candidatus Sumerlaeia bacterium]
MFFVLALPVVRFVVYELATRAGVGGNREMDMQGFAIWRWVIAAMLSVAAPPLLLAAFSDRRAWQLNAEEYRLLPLPPAYILCGQLYWGLVISGGIAIGCFLVQVESLLDLHWSSGDVIVSDDTLLPIIVVEAITLVLVGTTLRLLMSSRRHALPLLVGAFLIVAIAITFTSVTAVSLADTLTRRRDWGGNASILMPFILILIPLGAAQSIFGAAIREQAIPAFHRHGDPERWREVSWWGRESAGDYDPARWADARATLLARRWGHLAYGFLGVVVAVMVSIQLMANLGRFDAEAWTAQVIVLSGVVPPLFLMARYRARGGLPLQLVPGRLRATYLLLLGPLLAGYASGAIIGLLFLGSLANIRPDELVMGVIAPGFAGLALLTLSLLALIPRRGRGKVLLAIAAYTALGLFAPGFLGIWIALTAAAVGSLFLGLPGVLLQRIHRLEVVGVSQPGPKVAY